MRTKLTRGRDSRYVPYGFSWAFFFFGFLVFMARGQFWRAFYCVLYSGAIFFITGMTLVMIGVNIDIGIYAALVAPMVFNGGTGNYYSIREYMGEGWRRTNTYVSGRARQIPNVS